MALDVTINSGATTYKLKVETATIIYERNPLQAVLLGNVNPILIDLGQFKPSIVLEGRVDEVAPAPEGGVPIPAKTTLEDVLRQWYNTTITVTISNDAYVSKVFSYRFVLISGREIFWEFQIRFVTLGRT